MESYCIVLQTCAICYIGRQFFQAEDVLFTAKQATYRECLEAGVQCFLLAIDVRVFVNA